METGRFSKEKNLLSVVIATLGGDSLEKTIDHLNVGTIKPFEILICIPTEDAYRVNNFFFKNVRIIKTLCRGQVAQRAIGFQKARGRYVLQLDDDVLLKEDALQELVEELQHLGRGNALAPLYYNAVTGRCIHEPKGGFSGWLFIFWTYSICGAPWGLKRMGVVTAVGLNYGVDGRHCGIKPFKTQWLPGGCVLCFSEDVIRENFFPYKGKAYCEDLMHSFLRTKKGICHWVIPSAKCSTTVADAPISRASIEAENNARRYYVKMSGGVEWRLNLYSLLYKLKRQLQRFKDLLNK